MQISFTIDLSNDDQAALSAIFGCQINNLGQRLSRHALAALHEHVDCYLGRRASTRGSDILEYRLAVLIRHAFENNIPTEEMVSLLFQSTSSASRTLIRNSLAKYRFQLSDASVASSKSTLEAAIWMQDSGVYHSQRPAPNIVDVLNQRLRSVDPTLKPIARLPESGGIYVIDKFAYDNLCGEFNATAVARP